MIAEKSYPLGAFAWSAKQKAANMSNKSTQTKTSSGKGFCLPSLTDLSSYPQLLGYQIAYPFWLIRHPNKNEKRHRIKCIPHANLYTHSYIKKRAFRGIFSTSQRGGRARGRGQPSPKRRAFDCKQEIELKAFTRVRPGKMADYP